MSDEQACCTAVVKHPLGIHLRPASLIVGLAKKYQAKIEIVRDRQRVDGRSILDLLTMAIEQGSEVRIEAIGPDAEEAATALAELIASDFADDEQEPKQTQG
ncbi:MAG: HPr family phosphocarrier protein [Pirellulales bacterium]|nr:HPr family phosphocarrier protein [Pirellulales bacterium]